MFFTFSGVIAFLRVHLETASAPLSSDDSFDWATALARIEVIDCARVFFIRVINHFWHAALARVLCHNKGGWVSMIVLDCHKVGFAKFFLTSIAITRAVVRFSVQSDCFRAAAGTNWLISPTGFSHTASRLTLNWSLESSKGQWQSGGRIEAVGPHRLDRYGCSRTCLSQEP